MDRDIAKSLLELSKSIDPILAGMFAEVGKFGDEALRARMKRAVGDLMGFVARDVIFPIEDLYPDLRERPEPIAPPRTPLRRIGTGRSSTSPEEIARPDHSEGMWLWRANKVDFITSETAIEIVRRVIHDRYGQDEVNRNEPLAVTDDGETWLVRGTVGTSAAGSTPRWMGPIKAHLTRFDEQILGFIFEGDPDKLFGS